MNKLFKKLTQFGIIATIVALMFSFGVELMQNKNSNFSTLPNQTEMQQTANTISASTEIFGNNTDNMVSYLVINPKGAALTSLNIKQEIGTALYTLTQDELGRNCNFSGSTENTSSYYFTTPARYIVNYSIREPDGSYSNHQSSFDFAPSLVESNIANLRINSGEKSSPVYIYEGEYYIFADGELDLTYAQNLYNLVLTGSVFTAKTTPNASATSTLVVPKGYIGKTSITFKSKNGTQDVTLTFNILTPNLVINYYNANYKSALSSANKINKANFSFDPYGAENYYVFNSALSLNIAIDKTTTKTTQNMLVSSADINKFFDLLAFSITQKDMNAQNTGAIVNTELKDVELLTDGDGAKSIWFYTPEVDHSVFELNCNLGDLELTNSYSKLQTFKVITKVPVSSNNIYDFAIYLNQYSYSVHGENINYLRNCLNGVLTNSTTITNTVTSTIRILKPTGDSVNLAVKENGNVTELTQLHGYYKDIIDKVNCDVLVYVNNTEFNFNTFYAFRFNTYCYNIDTDTSHYDSSGVKFTLSNTFSFDTNSKTLTVSDYYQSSSGKSYNVTVNSTLTYNGTQYINFYDFLAGDHISFTKPGNYKLEIYTLPNYEMASYISTEILTSFDSYKEFYQVYEFTVSGTSIIVTTSNNNEILKLNDYSKYAVNANIQLSAGDTFNIYRNNVLFLSGAESTTVYLNTIGSWRIEIVNGSNIVAKHAFTLLTEKYQGFTFNKQANQSLFALKLRTSVLPVAYEDLPIANSYHLLTQGVYVLTIGFNESAEFLANGVKQTCNAYAEKEYSIEIEKQTLGISLDSGEAGGRITTNVIITNLIGSNLKSLVVLLNGNVLKEYTAAEIASFDSLSSGNRSFSKNGLYTIQLTDNYGNVYELQIEKYYKTNAALIVLIVLVVTAVVSIAVIITKTRRRVRVK